MHIAVIGNGILGHLASLYFKRRFGDDVRVTMIGPGDRGGLPLVGESIIEITSHFLETHLGMSEYLMKHHLPKYALTYYFKLDPENPNDRTYSVHCNERAPVDQLPLPGWEGPMARPPSWLLNRHTFDPHLREMVAGEDIEQVTGLVKDIDTGGPQGNRLTVAVKEGRTVHFDADWVIDASGRSRFLGKKFDLTVRPDGQRNCFWFRVEGFDRSILSDLNALGPMPPGPGEPYHYERYYSTHHFMGQGNWIWMIPLKGEGDEDMMSIGLVSHPDHYPYDVRSIDDFYEQVGKVHPVVTDLVRSGRVLDTNVLRRYHYISKQYYSTDRWAVVGDAAFAPDPLFSNGLAFGTIQLEQIGEMIAQDCVGRLTEEYVDELNNGFQAPVVSSQTAITNWYETMGDAYLSSLRLNWIEVTYFYMFLPLTINRCHYEPGRMRYWKVMQLRNEGNPFEIPPALVEARSMFDRPTPDHFIYRGKEKVNLRALEKVSDMQDLVAQFTDGKELLNAYTRDVLDRIRLLNGS